jgi:hypothetical protein
MRYTYIGDANLDGKVNSTDLAMLSANWVQSGKGWHQGDFDYNGKVNLLDLILFVNNWQAGVTNPLGAPALAAALSEFDLPPVTIPEPASFAIVALAGLPTILARRRRPY